MIMEKINEDSLLLRNINYEKLGFKCGIEIHRRMKGKKLFCRCNANLNETEDAKEILRIRRFLSISKSEREEIDKAALEEILKGKYYEYIFYDKGCCLIDSDEEPPLPPEEDTIIKALRTSLMLNCKLPSEILFMRKIVVDGSNTTGFQRTGIIGYNGYISTSKGEVGIQTVCLEEESAQIIEKTQSKVVYDLRRLGIPLIEIATSPDLKDGEHAKEVAKKIGDLLKSTGYYQRGLGSIRQDINISIKEGCRVEIKGLQDLDLIPVVVEKEVQRQYALIKLKEMLKNTILDFSELKNVSDYFKNSKSRLFANKEVYAFSLKGMRGLFKVNITSTKRLGSEIAGYVRIKTKSKGFIHTDEDIEKYNIQEEVGKITNEIFSHDDLVVFIIGSKSIAEEVRGEIIRYFEDLKSKGLENETRKVLENGDTTFLRTLPGSARMYPETDIPPIWIDDGLLKRVVEDMPKTLDEIIEELSKHINREMLSQFINSKYFDIYLENVSYFKENTDKKISTILNVVKDIERKEKIDVLKKPEYMLESIDLWIKGRISKEGLIECIKESYKKDIDPLEIINTKDLWKISREEIVQEMDSVKEKELRDVIAHFKKKYGVKVEIKEIVEEYNKREKHVDR